MNTSIAILLTTLMRWDLSAPISTPGPNGASVVADSGTKLAKRFGDWEQESVTIALLEV